MAAGSLPFVGSQGLSMIICSQGHRQKTEAAPGLLHLGKEAEKPLPTVPGTRLNWSCGPREAKNTDQELNQAVHWQLGSLFTIASISPWGRNPTLPDKTGSGVREPGRSTGLAGRIVKKGGRGGEWGQNSFQHTKTKRVYCTSDVSFSKKKGGKLWGSRHNDEYSN